MNIIIINISSQQIKFDQHLLMKHIQFGFATLIRCHVSKQVLTIAISHSFTLKRVKILINTFLEREM